MCAHHFILIVTVLLLLSGCVCELFPVCVCACSYVYFNVGLLFLSNLSVLLS